MLEVSQLTELLKDRLGITALPPPMMGMPMAGMPAAGDAPAAGASASESAQEKTEFAVKLTGFDAASKIKVIKEVRAVPDLGLKEAKEMVEKGEFVVKDGLGREEAEGLVKKLEAVGGVAKLE